MIEHNFKKKFGQNFLTDKNIINKIISVSNIKNNSLIIEIGPGSGSLTRELIKYGQVLAYEIDTELRKTLDNEFSNTSNIEIIYDDFLNRNIKKDLEKYKYNNLYVIANLPYYITTPIIIKLIEEKINLEKMVIMVQKEVGERFSAKVGTKDYSSITIFLNYYYNIKQEFIVSKNSFIPKPKVDSVILSLTKKQEKYKVKNEEIFFKLVKDSFKYKRKTLKNNLKNYNFSKIEEVLLKNNKKTDVRAEALSIEDFIEISNNL